MVYIPVHVSAVILLQIVMVGPGTHLVKNHKSLSITNESQLKKKQGFLNWKCLGFFAGGKPVQLPGGYFTSVAKDLNSGLPRTNSASRQDGNCTQSLLITILADWPLDHVASLWIDRLQVPVIKYESE